MSDSTAGASALTSTTSPSGSVTSAWTGDSRTDATSAAILVEVGSARAAQVALRSHTAIERDDCRGDAISVERIGAHHRKRAVEHEAA